MMSNTLKVDRDFRLTSYMAKSFPTYDAYEFERENFNLYMPHYVLLKGNVATEQTLEAIETIEKKLDTFEDIEHILFPFNKLPDDLYFEKETEFPHKNTRKPAFMQRFFSVNE